MLYREAIFTGAKVGGRAGQTEGGGFAVGGGEGALGGARGGAGQERCRRPCDARRGWARCASRRAGLPRLVRLDNANLSLALLLRGALLQERRFLRLPPQ